MTPIITIIIINTIVQLATFALLFLTRKTITKEDKKDTDEKMILKMHEKSIREIFEKVVELEQEMRGVITRLPVEKVVEETEIPTVPQNIDPRIIKKYGGGE